MEKRIITEKLTTIFRDVFKDKSMVLNDDLSSNSVEKWNSLTHMVLLNSVENEFGIKFKLKDLMKIKTVGDLISIIYSYKNEENN
ncbi:MAG TPA: acyl carrier protein [Bacteroidales bacterium]|nr:acyl carrier protein [Bacteroidales bacterium]